MTTARILIKKSLQKIGAITKNEAPSADEINDGLDSLNALLESWANESLLCFALVKETFQLNSSGEYTIGEGQTLDTVAPNLIRAAVIRWENTDYPLNVIPDTSFEQYVPEKNTPGLPNILSYDGGYPVGKISLFPTPMTAYSLRLMSEKPLQKFTLDDEVELPPGWERALIYSNAIEQAPEYGMPVDANIDRIATQALAAIRRATARSRSLDALPMNRFGNPNIYNGYRW